MSTICRGCVFGWPKTATTVRVDVMHVVPTIVCRADGRTHVPTEKLLRLFSVEALALVLHDVTAWERNDAIDSYVRVRQRECVAEEAGRAVVSLRTGHKV